MTQINGPRLSPAERELALLYRIDPDAERTALSVQDVAQPVCVFMRRAVQPEISDLQRRHLELDQPSVRRVYARKIHQHQIVPEFLVSLDAFVIVQEIAAAIEDRLFLVDFDPLRMVRRMAVDDVDARQVDQRMGEGPLPRGTS